MSAGAIVAVLCAVATIAGWLGLLGWLMFSTKTPSIRTGPPTQALRPEAPALVDFVTGDWKLCDEAASATLLDLAARRFVTIEEVGPELSLVRLGRNVDTSALTRYEQLVIDHVTKLATADGVVATGALAEGARNLGSWWKKFSRAVRDEARAAGLSEARWLPVHRTILTGAAAIPAVTTAIAAALYLPLNSSGERDPFGALIFGFCIVFLALVSLQEKVNGERGTRLGAEVAGHWLGVQDHMATARFGEQPAAGVTVWGRPLAYAAALGLAERAVVSLPISTPADDGKAWSDYGGMWHQVQVRYHGKGPWGRFFWGRTAWSGIGNALLGVLMCAGPLFIVSIVASAFLGFPSNPIRFAVFCAGVIVAVPLILGLIDMTSRTTVTGQVVRQRRFVKNSNDNNTTYRYWIGIDDGSARITHAYGVDEPTYAGLLEGDVVEARVGKWLGWMYDVRTVTPSRHRSPAAPQAIDPTQPAV
ncbi:DUF2207 family protein [Antrihabitans cavernicola]|uniref:DUF2207 domain-containing protein n=1 Tax=Antrihabitans cavernicola TaxID=2495913 RepID=A0A5A7S7P7_9NOCA|nr:DUF2207 domain-containing protein [Spelaeibacter cavernicola]KAA0021926.1 DUF2207 domain-containing protein [Spelaeibacter cavernicola]